MSAVTPTPIAESEKGHTDPAAALVAGGRFVPVQTRSARFHSFDPEAFERPSGREVNWKHTPVGELAALFADDAAPHGVVQVDVQAPEGVEQPRLAHGVAPRGEVFDPEDLPSAIAWMQETDAPLLRIPAGAEFDEPIVVNLTGTGGVAHAHVVIEAQANSRAMIVFRHTGTAHHAQNIEIIVRDGAQLTVVSLQEWDDDAIHLAAHQARIERDALLRHIVVSFGGAIVRVNPSVELAGSGAQGELYGLSFADAGQHLESQVYLHHKGANTRGDVLYKSALQGAGARTVWIGDVLIGPDATGTDSYEANRNLVLTEGARADSIPNLEIETGDIRGAGHASATGRFDEEQLFYLQARGIPEDEARRLVVLGFLVEIVQKIGDAALQERLIATIESELADAEATASVPAEGDSPMTQKRACALSDLQQDAPKRVVIDKVPMAVVLDGNGEVHAIGDVCTHGDISLSDGFVEGDTLECWAHGSAFSLRTGHPLNLPAYEPVPVYQVVIDGDDVLIDPAVTVAV